MIDKIKDILISPISVIYSYFIKYYKGFNMNEITELIVAISMAQILLAFILPIEVIIYFFIGNFLGYTQTIYLSGELNSENITLPSAFREFLEYREHYDMKSAENKKMSFFQRIVSYFIDEDEDGEYTELAKKVYGEEEMIEIGMLPDCESVEKNKADSGDIKEESCIKKESLFDRVKNKAEEFNEKTVSKIEKAKEVEIKNKNNAPTISDMDEMMEEFRDDEKSNISKNNSQTISFDSKDDFFDKMEGNIEDTKPKKNPVGEHLGMLKSKQKSNLLGKGSKIDNNKLGEKGNKNSNEETQTDKINQIDKIKKMREEKMREERLNSLESNENISRSDMSEDEKRKFI